MGMTDPIADMLTRIRNAGMAKHPKLDMPASKINEAIGNVLADLGYIKSVKVTPDNKQGILRIQLKYDADNQPVINEIKRVSSPGCRVYVGKDEIPQVKNGLGCAILSTSKGVMHDAAARKSEIGGEVICTIW